MKEKSEIMSPYSSIAHIQLDINTKQPAQQIVGLPTATRPQKVAMEHLIR